MSFLMLSELSLSEQTAVVDAFAQSMRQRYDSLFTLLDSSAPSPFTPSERPYTADESTPLPGLNPPTSCCSASGVFLPSLPAAAKAVIPLSVATVAGNPTSEHVA